MALVAELANPLLLLAVLAAPFLGRRRPWAFWLRTGAGIAAAYALALLDRRLRLWAGVGLDYSTHTACALTFAVALAAADRRWLWGAVPVLLGYAALMVRLGYHSPADIATTAAAVAPLAALAHFDAKNPRTCQSVSPSRSR